MKSVNLLVGVQCSIKYADSSL